MIRKLKIKFVVLSMTSLFILLTLLVTGMNVINYHSVVTEADEVLSLLSRNKGSFPDMGGGKGGLPPHMSPELPYESRYFSVLLNREEDIIHTETSRIVSVEVSTAIAYAQKIVEDGDSRGFIDKFRFVKYSDGNDIRITFLDWGRQMDAFWNFLFVSCSMAFLGFIIVFLVIVFFSEKIIRPMAESYEKQKRFITDAGHEMKTPLTIINANVDVLEMDLGQNECLEDIKQETKRLTDLTNDLVCLARMEEGENTLQMIEFPVSEVVQETAEAFRILAQAQNKEFVCKIQPMLSMKGNSRAIQQLISILMDNALKYSPEGGKVALHMEKQNKMIYLSVCNTTEMAVNNENLKKIFDRFYRIDSSRNSETGGHGIGLSIAKAIVTRHNGKIYATKSEDNFFRINVTLPM